MDKKINSKKPSTLCIHEGNVEDTTFGSTVSPIYMGTSYKYSQSENRYPRYFNTPNQEGLSKKIASLEKGEKALVFGSGMAAISTTLLSFLKKGDHVVFQKDLYGGTTNLINKVFKNFGIKYSLVTSDIESIKKAICSDTKIIYVESPSNPLLKIIDLEKIGKLGKEKKITTIIDNTFASPINQQPIELGIDVVIHSGTKYLGGHSDISAGAVISTTQNIDCIHEMAKNLGGHLSDYTVWLLERSVKTLSLRVAKQNENALKMAQFLSKNSNINKVYYPGLESHEGHEIAKKQMKNFGGMLSFSLKDNVNADLFLKALKLIPVSLSLAGVESSILQPHLTSHVLLTDSERAEQGISSQLLRFSLGIEHIDDLTNDIENALIQL